MELRPHDLLRLASPDALETVDAPGWVAASLNAAPWVVVRRAGEAHGEVAIGVRGASRDERFGAYLRLPAIAERVSPETLHDRPSARAHPAFNALLSLRHVLDGSGLVWGPTGAAGYELATGRPALTGTSDLDLIVRTERPPTVETLAAIAAAAVAAPLRVDILVETPAGAVALDELLGGGRDVLLRTPEGPRLVVRASLLARAPC